MQDFPTLPSNPIFHGAPYNIDLGTSPAENQGNHKV